MTLPKEKKQARFMMHLNVIIGAFCIILFVISIAMKIWISAIAMVSVMFTAAPHKVTLRISLSLPSIIDKYTDLADFRASFC